MSESGQRIKIKVRMELSREVKRSVKPEKNVGYRV